MKNYEDKIDNFKEDAMNSFEFIEYKDITDEKILQYTIKKAPEKILLIVSDNLIDYKSSYDRVMKVLKKDDPSSNGSMFIVIKYNITDLSFDQYRDACIRYYCSEWCPAVGLDRGKLGFQPK